MPKPQARSKAFTVMMDSEVLRRIRQHARAHAKTEVCGVLIGSGHDGTIRVTECIAGENASQAGTHVTFTQGTWEHVYKVKDAEFPDSRIVGWYHSHPGFGVFLSDHDTFIHKNFFCSHDQIAWVYDPHSDEEGCFGWAADHIQRIASIHVADRRGGEKVGAELRPEPVIMEDKSREREEVQIRYTDNDRDGSSKVNWAVTILTHLCAILLGLILAWFVFPRVLVVPIPVDARTGRPVASPPASDRIQDKPQIQSSEPDPGSAKGRDAK